MTAQEKSKTIMIVEDNELNMELVRDILVVQGYNVLEAINAEQCRDHLKSAQPDMILMDIQLPRVNGYTLVKEIRANEKIQHIPVIALTAFAMPGDREKAIEAGCDDVITKPIDTKQFLKSIDVFFSHN